MKNLRRGSRIRRLGDELAGSVEEKAIPRRQAERRREGNGLRATSAVLDTSAQTAVIVAGAGGGVRLSAGVRIRESEVRRLTETPS